MKTIEQYEIDIARKSELIESQLGTFQENIGNIGHIIGKDPTVVHDLLTKRYNETMMQYRTTTRRNAEILSGYEATLDKILTVLEGVMLSIQKIEESRSGEEIDISLEIDKIMEDVSIAVDNIEAGADIAAAKASEETGIPKELIIGGSTYVLMKFIGFSNIWSIAGGIAAGMYLGKNSPQEGQA